MGRLLGDRYQVLHPVWCDRLGETHVARDRTTGGPVAVRILRGELATDPVANRFRSDRARLTTVRHPHLAGVLDLVVDGDTLAIVSQVVPGRTLRHQLRTTGAPAPVEAARIGAGVAAGLQALHHAGLLHQNLKPDNVLVTPDGQAQLTDIAVAHLLADSPSARHTLRAGLPVPAPELVAGAAPTEASDLYLLGVLLHELTRHRWSARLRGLVRQLRARDPRARPSAHQVRTHLL